MKRTLLAGVLGSLLLCGPAAAVPGVDEPDTIHVKALRNPEIRKYKAILAGLDSFDRHHALAPKVPELRFRVAPRRGAGLPEALKVRIEGERDFVLPIALDAANRFTVPRSEAALDAEAELVLNQKRRLYQVMPEVRTPGLPENVRRLGDLRLECKVMFDIAKEEIPLLWVLTINSVLLTRDWCSFFAVKNDNATFSFKTGAPIVAAILSEGKRSKALETEDDEFRAGLGDADWGDEALVEFTFAGPAAAPAGATGTAAETTRTAP
ncbi:hypothetical protein ACHAC9_18015 [Massilia sp. CMS3.1]|uniref:hypothetical protein n=1 Tax=Massilia sp. CMS3.1 TaxID=3373083 RepID=UPI003EE744D0